MVPMLPIAIGMPEFGIIAGIVVLLFGVKKLPEIGRGLAEGIHEFKKASKEIQKPDIEEPVPAKNGETKE